LSTDEGRNVETRLARKSGEHLLNGIDTRALGYECERYVACDARCASFCKAFVIFRGVAASPPRRTKIRYFAAATM
jgi:hypothetical protein